MCNETKIRVTFCLKIKSNDALAYTVTRPNPCMPRVLIPAPSSTHNSPSDTNTITHPSSAPTRPSPSTSSVRIRRVSNCNPIRHQLLALPSRKYGRGLVILILIPACFLLAKPQPIRIPERFLLAKPQPIRIPARFLLAKP